MVASKLDSQLSSSVHTTVSDFLKVLFIFGCAGFSLLHGLFSGCCEQGLLCGPRARVPHCGGFSRGAQGGSLIAAQASRAQGQELWCSGLAAPRHVALPGSGTKPESSALAGGLFVTEPGGKPRDDILK